ncbi:MAG: long-chain fatty acid--CoA ligase [Rhodobacteraceae bacterium]|nr:long-chain fatty acid--CoA ligase [Paracoccaceae bacterium]
MTPMGYDEAAAHLIDTNPAFAITTTEIRGVTCRIFANVPETLRDLLDHARAAHDDGNADYLVYKDERLTFDGFCAEVRATARALQDRGIGHGDRVAIAMRNYPELLILFLATASIGGVAVFINAWWTEEELDYALRDSRPKVVFADGPRMERMLPLKDRLKLDLIGVRDAQVIAPLGFSAFRQGCADAGWPQARIDPDDDFAIMYSSGTTGHPKGVVLTHRGAINAVYTWLMQSAMYPLMAGEAPDPNAKSVILVVTPLFHVTATHPVFLYSLPAGARVILMHKWDADEAVRLIETEKVTRFLGVPTQSADLMDAAERMGAPLDTLKYLGAGGAKRPAAQVDRLAKRFPNAMVATGWGMTETNAIGIGLAGADYVARPGVCGRLYPPVQDLRFLDQEGRDVKPGEIGELTVKSPCNMREYLNKPEATVQVLKDGWLRTGDLGFIDPDGFVTIVDRSKNIIIRGGENIACLDVENALHHHPAVSEACAFPLPDERLGETVGALVRVLPGHEVTQGDLQAFLKDHIAHFKIPDHIWTQVDPLPRGATDKLDRRGIRSRCTEKFNEGASEDAGNV